MYACVCVCVCVCACVCACVRVCVHRVQNPHSTKHKLGLLAVVCSYANKHYRRRAFVGTSKTVLQPLQGANNLKQSINLARLSQLGENNDTLKLC